MLFSSANEISLENLARHKLLRQPFLDTHSTNDNDFFINHAIEMLIKTVAQTIGHSDSELCIIKGEKGVGKTCLANYLHFSQQPYTSFLFKAEKRVKLTQLLKAIINDENFNSDDTQHLAKQAAIEVFHVLKNGEQPTLIIDNAHLIKENTLLTLLRFTTAIKQQGVGKLKLILIAERSIDNIVDKIPEHHIKANNIHSVLLRPLSRGELEEYIKHRVTRSGSDIDLFNNKQIEDIAADSAGIPARINTAAVSILNRGKRKQFWLNKNIQFGGYIAAAIVFIGLAFLYISDSSKQAEPSTISNESETTKKIITETLPAQETQTTPALTTDINSDAITTTAEQNTPITLEASVDELSNITNSTDAGASPEVSSKEQINTDIKAVLEIQDTNTALENKQPNDKTQVPPEENIVELETLEIETLEVASDIKPITPNQPEKDYTKAEITDNTLYSHRWLLEQDSTHFALQLIGTANYEKLMEFAETIVTNCTLAYFRTIRNQSPWHVLLCGPYKDSEAAANDIINLPQQIQNNRPWPRDLATIQQKIRQP